jgi:hypothetical protein
LQLAFIKTVVKLCSCSCSCEEEQRMTLKSGQSRIATFPSSRSFCGETLLQKDAPPMKVERARPLAYFRPAFK